MAMDATKTSLTLAINVHAKIYLHNTRWCAKRKA